MKFIGYPQLEELLTLYTRIQSLVGSLTAELKAFVEQNSSVEDRLASMAIGNRVIYQDSEQITATPEPGKRMTAVIADYHDAFSREDREAIKEILADLDIVNLVLGKLNHGLNGLKEAEMEIIEAKYFKGYTWALASDTVRLSEGQGKKLRREAIEQMLPVCRIKVEDYEAVIRIIKGGEL